METDRTDINILLKWIISLNKIFRYKSLAQSPGIRPIKQSRANTWNGEQEENSSILIII